MVEFSPHGGIVSIQRIDRILRIEGGGATNPEGVRQYLGLLDGWMAEIGGQPWAVLAIVVDQEALLTPDAEALLRDQVCALSRRGRIAMGLVCPPRPGRQVLIGQWQRIYLDSGCAMRIFDTEPEARQWLDSVLAAQAAEQPDA